MTTTPPVPLAPFYELGAATERVNVQLSYRIIRLFSEGLYSSPNKAVEELVANSFDAGATEVHVVVSPNLRADDASIVVLDNGVGMNIDGLKQHWIVGSSNKRDDDYLRPRGRRPIGKFGIGKLASYVLGDRLTHISKQNGEYYSTSMDYRLLPDEPLGASGKEATGQGDSNGLSLSLRKLSEQEAQTALATWAPLVPARAALKLFGPKASPTWTVAVMSNLKDMATGIAPGRLGRVLETAMPLRPDFKLYLNSRQIQPSKLTQALVARLVLGRDILSLKRPGPVVEVSEDVQVPADHDARFGLSTPTLGRFWGVVEVYEDRIDSGKSDDLIGRSNGFFIYARERLLSGDDPGFGIDRNVLQHRTLSRFRAVIHIDALDEDLQISRESLREGPLLIEARNVLQGLFNEARARIQESDEAKDPKLRLARRLSASPASLVERPVIEAIHAALAEGRTLRTVSLPPDLEAADYEAFVNQLVDRTAAGGLFASSEIVDLDRQDPIAVFDAATGVIQINAMHPFVANFMDDFKDSKRNLPVELLAASEIVLEASLRRVSDPNIVDDVLTDRDELLRVLAATSGRRTALTIAADLLEAVRDKDALERAVVDCFNSLGFDAIPRGGSDAADGIAAAPLVIRNGRASNYKVSLEAKSKVEAGKRVSKDAVGVATIARHRDDEGCDHAIVIGPDFATTRGEDAAVVREIDEDRRLHQEKRTITLMRARDLARLVRHAPAKGLGLTDLRELFIECRTPDECADWVEKILQRRRPIQRFQQILEVIWEEQSDDPASPITYSRLVTALRLKREIRMDENEVKEACKALSQMTPLLTATNSRVELDMRPAPVLEAIGAVTRYEAEATQVD